MEGVAMKRHFVAAIFLAVGLAVPALAAEKSTVIGGAGGAAGSAVRASPSKAPKKAATKKKSAAEKGLKVAQIEKSGSGSKTPPKTTRRMRGYGN
jgi:hypothetical protein